MYNEFCEFYDEFAYDIPYEKFKKYYMDIFKKFDKKPEIVLDMCCGTGTLTTLMAESFDMIGIDASTSMLNIAKEKDKDGKILYINGEMADFELYGTVDCAYSSLDSINYILNDEDLKKHFSLMHNYLIPGGLYIFDISSLYKFKNILSNNIFTDENENTFFHWQNEFENGINTMYLDVFSHMKDDTYKRILEIHTEKAYTVSEVKKKATLSGFKVKGVYDELSFRKPKRNSQRIFFVLECVKS